MLGSIFIAFRWFLSIGNKFLKVVPGSTLIVIVATLISQFSIVLAFLLPLKVLMLLGSETVPHYFPNFLKVYSHDSLVIMLCGASVCFYLVYFLAEKVVSVGARHGALRLLAKSKKVVLFEKQDEIASHAYQRYSHSLANGVFVLMIAAFVAIFYPLLFLFLFGYLVLSFILLTFLHSLGGHFTEALNDTPGKVVNIVANIGFLSAFTYIVILFLFGYSPGLLVTMVSLVLMRQGSSRITAIVNGLKGLHKQRLKLNALFFHGHVFISSIGKEQGRFWSLLEQDALKELLVNFIPFKNQRSSEDLSIKWLSTGVGDVVFLFVLAGHEKAAGGLEKYLVKIFNSNRKSQAMHEATLLSEGVNVPAFSLSIVEDVQGFQCHILDVNGFKWPAESKFLKKEFLINTLGVEPGSNIISRYRRSKEPLWCRINIDMLERLRLVSRLVDGGYDELIDEFLQKRDTFVDVLQKLPLTFVNPDIKKELLLLDNNDALVSLHWARWSLEPIGAGWPLSKNEVKNLKKALDIAKQKRPSIIDVSPEQAYIAALAYGLERYFMRQQFAIALELLVKIVAYLNKIEEKVE